MKRPWRDATNARRFLRFNDLIRDGRQGDRCRELLFRGLGIAARRPGLLARGRQDQVAFLARLDFGGIALDQDLDALARPRHALDADALRRIAQFQLDPVERRVLRDAEKDAADSADGDACGTVADDSDRTAARVASGHGHRSSWAGTRCR